jgi:hypothetical protein
MYPNNYYNCPSSLADTRCETYDNVNLKIIINSKIEVKRLISINVVLKIFKTRESFSASPVW